MSRNDRADTTVTASPGTAPGEVHTDASRRKLL